MSVQARVPVCKDCDGPMIITTSRTAKNPQREYFICRRARLPETVFGTGVCGEFGGWVDDTAHRAGSRFRWGVPSKLVSPNQDKVLYLACIWNDPRQRFFGIDRPILWELASFVMNSKDKARVCLESRTLRHYRQRDEMRTRHDYENLVLRMRQEDQVETVLSAQREEVDRERDGRAERRDLRR
jgi:hypothetical protein